MGKMKLCILGLILIAVMCLPFLANGESGSVDVPANEVRTVSLGNLIAGTTVQYSWATDDSGDKVDFKITDGTNDYQKETRVDSATNIFTVPSNGDYNLYWFCDNWFDTANVEYSYSIILPDPNADLVVTYTFSENPCHQGNTTELNIVVKNIWDDQIRITEVGVHFDFLPEDVYLAKESLEDILATDQQTGYSFDVEVNTDVSLGIHKYDVYIEYDGRLSGQWVSDIWISDDQLDFSVIEIDRDFDGYPDSQDTFPDNPNEFKDMDSDGVGDNSDAFPDDPAASVDSDGDGYPDNWNTGMTKKDSTSDLSIDNYPQDPERWKEEEKSNILLIVIIVGVVLIILIIIVAVVIFALMRGRKKGGSSPPPPPRTEIAKNHTQGQDSKKEEPKSEAVLSSGKLEVCPLCGKKLDFSKTPKYCPYCNGQILK